MYYSLQQYSELHCCHINGSLMPAFRSWFLKSGNLLNKLPYSVALAVIRHYVLGITINSKLPC